jgi:hypothetical protein
MPAETCSRPQRTTAFLLLVAVKLLGLIVSPTPRFFLGDSQSYLFTATSGWVPPDRSFVYGWLVGALCSPAHSLFPLLLVQSLSGAVGGLILMDVACRFFNCSPPVGFLAGLLFVLDPLQLYFERAILTESLALLFLVLGLWALLAYAKTRRLSALIAAAFLFAILALLRQAFLSVAAALLAAAPLIAILSDRTSRIGMRVILRSMVVGGSAVVVLAGLLLTYVYALAAWKHVPAQMSRSDGFFLASYFAPLLEPSDFEDPDRELLFAPSPFALHKRGVDGYTPQMFAPGGLVDRLRIRDGDLEGNALARRIARTAARRHPLRLLALAGQTFLDYFDPMRIRASFHTALGLDRDLPPEMLQSARELFGYDAEPDWQRHAGRLTLLLEKAWLLHLVRLVLGLLLVVAAVRSVRRDAPMVLIGSTVALTMASLCFMTIMDIRYLHSFSWLSCLALALAGKRFLRRGGQRLGSGDRRDAPSEEVLVGI